MALRAAGRRAAPATGRSPRAAGGARRTRAARAAAGAGAGRPDDEAFMREAVELALRAQGKTHPNPVVGCIIVSASGEVVGRGFHPKAGEPHAEIFALRDAGLDVSAAAGDPEWTVEGDQARGCTAYVTLEPCDHVGRTPPCSRALVAAGVSRVVVGCGDPDPRVDGGGIRTLQAAGVEVSVGVEEQMCLDANVEFFDRLKAERDAANASS
eukprot:PRCOL_00002917-RA